MDDLSARGKEPVSLSRRELMEVAAAGAISLSTSGLSAEPLDPESALAAAIARLQYLTPADRFREFPRERPHIDQLPPETLRRAGLDRETWSLEVIPDPEGNAKVEWPLSREAGTALDWKGLMKLAETRAVRFLNVLSCTNMAEPIGMGLWEGVPLREVVWLARPKANIRRVYYYGYHNNDPKQRFQSSLTIGRVLEDPPGELPAILCYKLNGQWLPTRVGGPVRMVVPGSYGNKYVKWLQRIVLTSSYQANDTYALWGNDVESPMKTCARFIDAPAKAGANQPVPLVGFAHVGLSGLKRVQYSVHPQDAPLPPDDPFLEKLDWKDARILPPPGVWGGGVAADMPATLPLQFDPATSRPRSWPLRYTIAHWASLMSGQRPGKYTLRCRTIDTNGVAQPRPRPFSRSGDNGIQQVRLVVGS
jgi:DMSO/TMAO reductase YedYZ molybdopterin-dependent catalytic subunit